MSQASKYPLQTRKDLNRTDRNNEPSVVPFRDFDSPDGTIPPTPLRDLLAADGASIFVFTRNAALLATVREAGGEQYPVFPASSWKELRQAVADQRCGIAVLDIESVRGPVTDGLAELSGLNPALVTLVASSRERADGLLDLLGDRKIHRLLITPATVGITRLLLESSVSRHIELRHDVQAEPDNRKPAASGKFARWSAWLLASAFVVAILSAVVLFSLPEGLAPEGVTVTWPVREPPAEPPAEPPGVAVQAESARSIAIDTGGSATIVDASSPLPADLAAEAAATSAGAVRADELAATADGPETETAAPGSVPRELELMPNAEPVAGGPASAELQALYAAVEAALIAADLDAAADLLGELETLDPGSSRLEFLSAQLEREQTRIAAVESAVEAGRAPTELTSLIGLARARLAQQQLVTPTGDSALHYLDRARAIGPDSPEVEAIAADLGAAILTAAEIELAEGRFASAEVLFNRAQMLGVSDEDLVGLELSLTYSRDVLERAEQDALLAQADQRLAQGQLFEPAAESALAAVLEVQRRNPEHPGLPAAFDALEQALQATAETALAGADWDAADAAAEALSRTGAPLQALNALRADALFGRRQEAYLAEPAPASELALLALEAPVYPNRAVARGIEGWVDLEFIVDRQGRVRNAVVTGAEPAGEFEASALAAAEAYVFEPFELDGRSYERRVGLRMRFALQ